jgi:predicted GIY-YIG superfamily endonuclease
MISIYKIVDNTNGNIYVGSTKLKMKKRIQGHNYDFKKNKHCTSSIILKNNDWNYYVIEECEEDKR